MKRSTKIIIISIVSLGVIGCIGAKKFGHHNHDPEQRAAWVTKFISHKLDLNDPQKTKLDELKNSMLSTIKSVKDENNTDIKSLFKKQFDKTKALSMINNHTQNIKNAAPQVMDKLSNFYDSLDAGQKVEVRKMLDRKMHHGRPNWKNSGDKDHE